MTTGLFPRSERRGKRSLFCADNMRDANLGQVCLYCGFKPARHLNRLERFEAECLLFCSFPCAAAFGHLAVIKDGTRWCPSCNFWTQPRCGSTESPIRECCDGEGDTECPHGQELPLENDCQRPCFQCEVGYVGAFPLAVPPLTDALKEGFFCGNMCGAQFAVGSSGDGSYYWCHECNEWIHSVSGKYTQKTGDCTHTFTDENGDMAHGARWPI